MADNRLVMRLYNAQQAHSAIQQAWAHAKGYLMASGSPMVLEVRQETRSDRQNKLLHALFADIARQAEWAGKKRTAEQWKVLFVSGHAVATKQGAEMVPGLEGEYLNLRESTARMSKARMASLLEYVMAWAVEHGVELQDAQQWQDTGEIIGGEK